jgi:hypothetical protein
MEIGCPQSLLSTKSTELQNCYNGEVPLISKNTSCREGGFKMVVTASDGIQNVDSCISVSSNITPGSL